MQPHLRFLSDDVINQITDEGLALLIDPGVRVENAEALEHPDPSPEEVTTTHLQLAHVSRALRTLTPEQADALGLRVYGELSAAQVGKVMGKSEAAIKMLVHPADSNANRRTGDGDTD